MRYCDHTFVTVTPVNMLVTADKNAIPTTTMVDKTIVACIYCGQVRHVYTNGRVVIEIQEGKIEKRGITTGQNNGDK